MKPQMARRNQHHGSQLSYQNAAIHYDAPDAHEGGPIARYAFLSILFPPSESYYDTLIHCMHMLELKNGTG